MTPAIPTSLDDSWKKLDKLRNAKPEVFTSDYDPNSVNVCFRRNALARQLRAVFAELERMRLRGLGPGATDTHESVKLVLPEQDFAAEDRDFLLGQNMHDGIERPPAASRSFISFDLCFLPRDGPFR